MHRGAPAERLARQIPGAYRPNQFANPNNPASHYETTGPEIWEDTAGRIDVFVASMSTGGTISGTAREDFIPKTFDRQVVDEMIRVSDRESFNTARRLAREEGLLVGGSAGTAFAAALKYAQRLTERSTIVVLLPDTGRNYLTKIYSDRWMQENGFWESSTDDRASVRAVLGKKKDLPAIVSVTPDDTLKTAIELFHRFNISQIPVMEGSCSVGSLQESTLLALVFDGVNPANQRVGVVMGKPLPTLDLDADISEAYRLLLSGASALVVSDHGAPRSVVTRIDLIDYYTRKSA